MAKVEYADAIKTVSGALTKINKKSAHAADQKMVLATHRVAPTTSDGCSRLYLRGLQSVTRSTPVTTEELSLRGRFAAVSAAVAARAKDLNKMGPDKTAFNAQKDQPGGKTTMKSYLWSLELAAWDQAHPRS
jgi:hypothetical protein